MKNNDIFEQADEQIRESIDPEQIVNIDIDAIGEESKDEALQLINDISRFYYDPDFMKEHPTFKKRVDADLESIRINLKMRKADEQAHDILLKNIGNNPGNASLYRALTETQRTILNITSKIEETVQRLNAMMKAYQMELNFEPTPSAQSEESQQTDIHRGSRSFIEDMSNVNDDDVDIPDEE